MTGSPRRFGTDQPGQDTEDRSRTGARGRVLLPLAGVAVAFAAADTYVVVLALPDMMTSVGLGIEELQRAAPIVSGFLLGYVAMLPLLGRLADLRGRVPVLVGSLAIFAVGSLVTAAAYDLPTVVAGRFLQGVGAGGLVPATLALVADLWPPRRRGLPLGMLGAAQELGSVLGPLYGALVVTMASWRAIFWLNLAVAVLLAGGISLAARRLAPAPTVTPPAFSESAPTPSAVGTFTRQVGPWRRTLRAPRPHSAPEGEASGREGEPSYDFIGAMLAAAAVVGGLLLLLAPEALTTDVNLGQAYVPLSADNRWLTPLALAVAALTLLFVARELFAARPLVDLRATRRLSAQLDLLGATLLGLALAGIVLAFASADPAVQVFSPAGPWLLGMATAAAAGFWARQRQAAWPLIPRRALSAPAAWGSLAVSFFIGAALIAALVDIPVYARVTSYPDSQLGAALVLVRFLAALPVGALAGGWLVRRVGPGPLTAIAMGTTAGGFVVMASWDLRALEGNGSTAALVLTGFGFGLAIAPVNAALLGATTSAVHGVASALVVVARMVGMLVGISALTTIGLRRFYAVAETVPPPGRLCPDGEPTCPAYLDALREAALAQISAIFTGAAVCALVAAALAALLYRRLPSAQVAQVSIRSASSP